MAIITSYLRQNQLHMHPQRVIRPCLAKCEVEPREAVCWHVPCFTCGALSATGDETPRIFEAPSSQEVLMNATPQRK
ncbi:hypothetical protein RRG08_029630 [Elysia crispata]|uniref:Uncharacterized protein n=1 Tax=Elysia crispata TaxID=231223 RepID=A0AAE0XPA9_9GAST|nr:hypothetical protein RRG08_029630 [Elysia crispata]